MFMPTKHQHHSERHAIHISPIETIAALLSVGVIRLLTGHQQLDNLQKPRGSTVVSTKEDSTDE
jgi:hypothetical protein